MKTLQSIATLAGLALLFVFLTTGLAFAVQTTTPSLPKLKGTIKDPSGAAMSAVGVSVLQEGKVFQATKSDSVGIFSFDLPAGQYQLAVTAPDFKTHFEPVRVTSNMPALTVTLSLEGITTAVDVVSNSDKVVVDAALSLDARVITAEQLAELPEDEESLLAFLQALAGGEGNAQLIIDSFEGGRMPTRDQIAQIVIEPNSFNATGTGPRITITTRQPGGTRWTGNARFQYRDSALNARTPHALNKPQSRTSVLTTSYTGPVIKGKLAMTFNLSKQQSESGNSSIRAITPGGPINTGVFSPSTYDSIGFSQNWYLSTNHTIFNSFDYNRTKNLNQGIGGFTLDERAYDSHDNGWNLQISDNKTLSPKMTNTFNFRMSRGAARTAPRTIALGINVLDAFNGGGAQNRTESSNSSFNINDSLRWTPSQKWNLQFNVNMNRQANYSLSESNYLGSFTFSSLEDYLAGRPLTFTQTSGNPIARTSQMDANISANATYRIAPTMSYSIGAQYMVQTHLKDYNNVSPTTQFQIQVKKRTTISLGARLSYSNFPLYYYEQLIRGDGTTRQFNTVISNPTYPDPFAGGEAVTTGVNSSRQFRDPNLVSPYTFNTQVSVTENLPKNWRFTTSFAINRSVHQIRNRNINAPFPGIPLDPTLTQDEINQLRPFYPNVGRINRFESVGNSFSRNFTLLVQVPSTTNKFLKTQFQGTFQYNVIWQYDDNQSQNPYNVRADWARNDQRHRVNTNFSIRPPKVGSFSLTLTATSGRAYSITSGKDENFDQSINDRPVGVKRNSLRGPGSYVMNLNWSSPPINIRKKKAPTGETASGAAGVPAVSSQDALIQSALNAGLPPAMIQQLLSSIASQPGGLIASAPGAPAAQPTLLRPQLTFTVSASNLLNNTRVNAYSGVITSPLFGRPISYGAGRSITMSVSSRF